MIKNIFRLTILIVCLIPHLHAGAFTLSGEELFHHPDITFFRSTPAVVGESLVFDEHRTDRWEKLFDLPILSAGQIPTNSPAVTISVSINLTRLTNDWDPYFTLSDDTNLTGAVISNNYFMPGLRDGTAWLYDFMDAGDVVAQYPVRPKHLISDAGFPDIGESLDVYLYFYLGKDITKIEVAFLEGTGTQPRISSLVIDRTTNISLVMLGENIFEKYQINSLTVIAPIPEPTIDGILEFFDDSVADGTLTGDGPGNSANGRLYALRNMLEMVSDLIDIDDIEGACLQLNAVIGKCDGYLRPKDFVTGEAVTELYDMILELMEELGCE